MTMYRMIRWLTPVLALGMVMAFSQSARAEEAAGNCTITGIVHGVDGKPVANAKVRVMKPQMDAPKEGEAKPQAKGDKPGKGGGKMGKPVAEATTDADGKFKIEKLAAGDYIVGCMVQGVGGGREKVTLKDGESKEVTINMKEMKEGAKHKNQVSKNKL
jgi:hypothetical protein